MNIYSISMNLRDIFKAIEENDGIITEEMEQALVIQKGQLEGKGVDYGYAIKHLEDNVSNIDFEIKRLQALKQRNEHMADKIRERIKNAMIEFGVEKIESATLKLSFTKSKETVIEDINLIPKQFLVPKTTYTPDKKAIKKAIEDGEVVTGAYIRNNQSLQIK